MFSRIKLNSEYQGTIRKDGNWQANHWKCTIKFDRRQFTFDYYMGLGLSGEPELDDVLESLLLDATAGQYTSFESWANDLGYDPDSRKAEEMYKACLRTAKNLQRVFPDQLEKLEQILEKRR